MIISDVRCILNQQLLVEERWARPYGDGGLVGNSECYWPSPPEISICVLCTDYWLTRERIWISKTIDQGFISATNRNNSELQSASSFAAAESSQVCLFECCFVSYSGVDVPRNWVDRKLFSLMLKACGNRVLWHTSCREALSSHKCVFKT